VPKWDDYPNANSRTYEEGLRPLRSLDGWQHKLRHANTPGSKPLPGPPTARQQWVRWGGKSNQVVTLPIAETASVTFESVLDAHIDLPTGWLLGLNFVMTSSDPNPANFDSFGLSIQALWGMGAAIFEQDLSLLFGPPPGIQRVFTVEGPIPAETLVVSASGTLVGNIAAVYPHTVSLSLGLFAAPQVWP
jgi:hypothetical protein